VLNLVAILILDYCYSYVAVFLTNWENHKTASAYEAHLTFKIVVFQFVNTYSSLFFIAFFKVFTVLVSSESVHVYPSLVFVSSLQQRDNGIPGDYNTLFGLRADSCPAYGCLLELTIQLCIIMVGKQILNNVLEVCLPLHAMTLYRQCQSVIVCSLLPGLLASAPSLVWEVLQASKE